MVDLSSSQTVRVYQRVYYIALWGYYHHYNYSHYITIVITIIYQRVPSDKALTFSVVQKRSIPGICKPVQGLLESTVMAVLAEFGIKAERWI